MTANQPVYKTTMAHWYFDFISPYAYLQSQQRQLFEAVPQITCKPILFAGLLNHWGHLGPAEIPSKRDWTFAHITWLAHQQSTKLTLPAHHPFNPLPLLRLCVAAGSTVEASSRIFQYVWAEGHLPQEQSSFTQLCAEFNLNPDDLNDPAVKTQVLDNGKQAIEEGVFGVPTLVHGQQLFWGQDASDMFLDYLASVSPDGETNEASETNQANSADVRTAWPNKQMDLAAALPYGEQRKR